MRIHLGGGVPEDAGPPEEEAAAKVDPGENCCD